MVALGTLRQRGLRRGVATFPIPNGSLKNMIFWAIDGPEFRDIKGSDFEAKGEKGDRWKKSRDE